MLNVHEPYMVSCLWMTSGVMSNVAVPRSPTKHARPHGRAALAQLARASALPVQSSVASAPSPCVSSRIASTGGVADGSIVATAPSSVARRRRSASGSTAIT